MSQRPSQCIACGCFQVCLYPESSDCAEKTPDVTDVRHDAEREEWASARDSLSEMDRAHDYDDMH